MVGIKVVRTRFCSYLRLFFAYSFVLSSLARRDLKFAILDFVSQILSLSRPFPRITKKVLGTFFLFACFSLSAEKVVIEYFFQNGCEDCEYVNTFVLPKLQEKFPRQYRLIHYDIGQLENYRLLLRLQENLNVASNDLVCMILNRTTYLGGLKNIENKLHFELTQALNLSPKVVA